MNDIPLSEQVLRETTGEAPEYPLSVQQIYSAVDLAARMMGAVLLNVPGEVSVEQAASIAVEMAYAIHNEARQYVLRDNRVVRKNG